MPRPRPKPKPRKRTPSLRAQLDDALERLRAAEETLDAIRTGEVDALVVQGAGGEQVFTLQGVDHRYRQLVETMNEGAVLVAAEGTIYYCNAKFAELVRRPLERVAGTPLRDLVGERWHGLVDAVLGARDHAGAKTEVELLAADGTIVPVYLSATPGRDQADRLTCVIVTDLTEQKRSQETLAAERLTALIIDQAAEAIVVCDLGGRVIRSSHAADRLCPCNPLLQPFADVFPLNTADGAGMAATLIEAALHGDRVHGCEVGIGVGEDRIELLVSAGPVLRDEGEPLGCVVSMVDVTERRNASEERNVLLARAEQALDLAETANRAKDEFLAMLGHELRNPLAPIITALELMRMRPAGPWTREREVIERQVKHVIRLVNDLLDVSRIARGKVDLRRETVDLAAVVARAIEEALPLIEQRRHRLQVRVPHGLWIHADETRICQVLANLLDNAAKYTPAGGAIVVEASRQDERIQLAVRDSGQGIPAELLPSVFDRFTQGERSVDRREGGLGLGLAIVKSLVTLHGGTVAVSSAGSGQGSEFDVTFPAVTAPVAREPLLAAPTKLTPTTALPRVLIVDDNQEAAELLSETLGVLGYHTRVAYDGPSAIEVAATFEPDIGLLDIGLPDMDGFELARRLRATDARVRLVALTGYGQDVDRRRSADAGFDLHLVKPVGMDVLASSLQSLA